MIRKAGFIAGLGLLLIYGGLIYNGALFKDLIEKNATRTRVLSILSTQTLGNIGTAFLSVLIALACFTTAVGIVIGVADFFKGFFRDSRLAYVFAAILSCILGIIIGQLNVNYIIKIALPALMFIYPITIVLIFLNLISKKYTSNSVFRLVVLITFLFSIPDFLKFLVSDINLKVVQEFIPLSNYSLAWLIPAIATFVIVNLLKNRFSFLTL